jgi:hypothetical protein
VVVAIGWGEAFCISALLAVGSQLQQGTLRTKVCHKVLDLADLPLNILDGLLHECGNLGHF